MASYRTLLRDGTIYAPLWEHGSELLAYYHEPTGWHLVETEERGHLVVDADGVLWDLPVNICGGGRGVGEELWDKAAPTDWTIADLKAVSEE